MTCMKRLRWLIAILSLLNLAIHGCAANKLTNAWIEDGKQLGTISKHKTTHGFQWDYFDVSGNLLRVDYRDKNESLLPGVSTKKLSYGIDGKLTEERLYDSQGSPTSCREGYVIKRHTYSVNNKSDNMENVFFCDKNGNQKNTINGFAIIQMTFEGSTNFIKDVYFLDEKNQTTAANWDNKRGVAHVKYVQLDGVGTVTCAVYYNPTGEIIERTVIKGSIRW